MDIKLSSWLISTANKCIKTAPRHTFLVVLGSFLSQSFLIVSFLLPIKTLMILGSYVKLEQLHKFFPGLSSREVLVVLGTATLVFYLLSNLSDRLALYSQKNGAKEIARRTLGRVQRKGQFEIVKKAYGDFLGSFAGFVFFAASFILALIVYMPLFVVAVLYVLLIVAMIIAYYYVYGLRAVDKGGLRRWSKYISSFGFFLLFFWVASQIIDNENPPLLRAIIGLILVRQGLNKFFDSWFGVVALYLDRERIMPLFFVSHKNTVVKLGGMSSQVLPDGDDIRNLIRNRLVVAGEADECSVEIESIRSSVSGASSLRASVASSSGNEVYLIKLYSSNRIEYYDNEMLIADLARGWPVIPEIASCGDFGEGRYLVYKITGLVQASEKSVFPHKKTLINEMMAYAPDNKFCERILAEKGSFIDYFDKVVCGTLDKVAMTRASRAVVEELKEKIKLVSCAFELLPLQVYNPDVKSPYIYVSDDLRPLVISWAKWELVPFGYGWKEDDDSIERLRIAVQKVSSQREGVGEIPFNLIHASALAGRIDYYCRIGSYSDSLSIVPDFLALVDGL